MLYSPTVTAIMGLSGAHDSALLQMTKPLDPITKSKLERQEMLIMNCFLELLGSLSEEDQKQVLGMVKVSP